MRITFDLSLPRPYNRIINLFTGRRRLYGRARAHLRHCGRIGIEHSDRFQRDPQQNGQGLGRNGGARTALLKEREYIPSMAGIRVPEDISVAGFDDTPICEMLRPALTTVRQDGALRAGLAVEKLRELKEGRPVETEIMLPVSLVVRNSTAPRRG